LFNLGGPEALDQVRPFLTNLFSDPDVIGLPFPLRQALAWWIAKRRTPIAQGYYEKIGGGSPLRRLTAQQASALETVLAAHGAFKVVVAMRYWAPFTEDAVDELAAYRPTRVVLLPLYPQYSYATTRSSLGHFHRVWTARGLTGVPIAAIEQWYDHPGYVAAMVECITQTVAEMPMGDGSPVHLLYSAHGVPLSFIKKKGDPYQRQIEAEAKLITARLPEWAAAPERVHLGYQSRVGPTKWLEPSTESVLHRLGHSGVTRLLVVPISFVSDHSETLYEIDILYRDLARNAGVRVFSRMRSLNDSPTFIDALADLVLAAR
jgi:ferrochelatase